MRFFMRMLAGVILGCGLSLGFGRAQTPRIDAAAWRLVRTDVPGGAAFCVPDRGALLRTGMPGARCATRVELGESGERIAYFTCRNAGWGRTTFRETGAGAMRIEAQGIRNGQPFGADYSAREVAACDPRP